MRMEVKTRNISFKRINTVELQWLEHLWNHENMFETGEVELMSINNSARSGGIIGIHFRFFYFI